MNDLEPLDPVYVQNVLSKPPFVTIPGVINVRDLGNYPSHDRPGYVTKPNYLLRSAELSGITDEGEQNNTPLYSESHGSQERPSWANSASALFTTSAQTSRSKSTTPLSQKSTGSRSSTTPYSRQQTTVRKQWPSTYVLLLSAPFELLKSLHVIRLHQEVPALRQRQNRGACMSHAAHTLLSHVSGLYGTVFSNP